MTLQERKILNIASKELSSPYNQLLMTGAMNVIDMMFER